MSGRATIVIFFLFFLVGCGKHSYFYDHEHVNQIYPRTGSESFFVVSTHSTPDRSKTNIALYDSSGIIELDSTAIKSFTIAKIEPLNDSILLIDASEDSTIFLFNYATKKKTRILSKHRVEAITSDPRYIAARPWEHPVAPLYIWRIDSPYAAIRALLDEFGRAYSFSESEFITTQWRDRNRGTYLILDSIGGISDSIVTPKGMFFNIGDIHSGRNKDERFITASMSGKREHSSILYAYQMKSHSFLPLIDDINVYRFVDYSDPYIIFYGYTSAELGEYNDHVEEASQKFRKENPGGYIDFEAPPGVARIRNLHTGSMRLLKNQRDYVFSHSGKFIAYIAGDYDNQEVIITQTEKLWNEANEDIPK